MSTVFDQAPSARHDRSRNASPVRCPVLQMDPMLRPCMSVPAADHIEVRMAKVRVLVGTKKRSLRDYV